MGGVHILWTGGWDSTFRLCQLSEYDIDIYPVYLKDSQRRGQEYELKAMNSILKDLRKNCKANIHDLKFYDVSWVKENCADEAISNAFKYIHEKYKVGIQYEWFALLAKKENLQFESAVVHQYHGAVEAAIESEGIMELIPNDFLPERRHVLAKADNNNASLVFENIILPVITLTKEDEQRIAEEKGWIDIMKQTWFCHSPINGEPCGLCNPCNDAMNTGMEWRMPKKAQWRYKHKFICKVIRRVTKK